MKQAAGKCFTTCSRGKKGGSSIQIVIIILAILIALLLAAIVLLLIRLRRTTDKMNHRYSAASPGSKSGGDLTDRATEKTVSISETAKQINAAGNSALLSSMREERKAADVRSVTNGHGVSKQKVSRRNKETGHDDEETVYTADDGTIYESDDGTVYEDGDSTVYQADVEDVYRVSDDDATIFDDGAAYEEGNSTVYQSDSEDVHRVSDDDATIFDEGTEFDDEDRTTFMIENGQGKRDRRQEKEREKRPVRIRLLNESTGKSRDLLLHNEEVVSFGRDKSSNVFLDEISVSKYQCILYLDSSGRPVLENKSKSNITKRNQCPLTAPQGLQERDTIQCGRISLLTVSIS